jgi:hypothetical protein
MNKSANLEMRDNESSAKLFEESNLAFNLILDGKTKEAADEFPFESHFIKKYVSSGLSELTELLKLRLELH